MQYDIQCRGFPATAALTNHVRRRLGFGLARHGSRVARVQVRLDDTIAPSSDVHGGCRIRIQLVDALPVIVQDLGTDLYALIDRCSDRAARGVAIRLERTPFGRRSMNSGPLPAMGNAPQRVAVAGLRRRRTNPRVTNQPTS